MCLPLSTPLLISSPHAVTRHPPHSLHRPLHLTSTHSILPSWLPHVLPTTPHLSSLLLCILLSIVLPPTPRPRRGPHPQFNPPSMPSHQLQWLRLPAHEALPTISPTIPSLCRLLTAVVFVSPRSCTDDTKQLQNQQRLKPCRQSLK